MNFPFTLYVRSDGRLVGGLFPSPTVTCFIKSPVLHLRVERFISFPSLLPFYIICGNLFHGLSQNKKRPVSHSIQLTEPNGVYGKRHWQQCSTQGWSIDISRLVHRSPSCNQFRGPIWPTAADRTGIHSRAVGREADNFIIHVSFTRWAITGPTCVRQPWHRCTGGCDNACSCCWSRWPDSTCGWAEAVRLSTARLLKVRNGRRWGFLANAHRTRKPPEPDRMGNRKTSSWNARWEA